MSYARPSCRNQNSLRLHSCIALSFRPAIPPTPCLASFSANASPLTSWTRKSPFSAIAAATPVACPIAMHCGMPRTEACRDRRPCPHLSGASPRSAARAVMSVPPQALQRTPRFHRPRPAHLFGSCVSALPRSGDPYALADQFGLNARHADLCHFAA